MRPHSAERVEFAIKLPGRGEDETPVAADRLQVPAGGLRAAARGAGARREGEQVEADKTVERVILAQAKLIRDKYIEPPHSTDFAIMYLADGRPRGSRPSTGSREQVAARVSRRPWPDRRCSCRCSTARSSASARSPSRSAVPRCGRCSGSEVRVPEVRPGLVEAREAAADRAEHRPPGGCAPARSNGHVRSVETFELGGASTEAIEELLAEVEDAPVPEAAMPENGEPASGF